MFKIAIICGGPSPERGISLNSARSLLDHLTSDNIEAYPFYVDTKKNFYSISKAQLYSNTPTDFDFKLNETAELYSESQLIDCLQKLDLIFPCIHGEFGEDGDLQAWLETHRIPFVGLSQQSCRKAFNKSHARKFLEDHQFAILPYMSLDKNDLILKNIKQFFKEHHLEKVVVKPSCGGSSIGVSIASTPEEAEIKCRDLFNHFGASQVLIESYCRGQEFTVVVLQNHEKQPVALIPTEIEMNKNHSEIFDYRRKYLPTSDTFYHTPPRFDEEIILTIRKQAEKLFAAFDMHDFIRMDGWVSEGKIYFTDFNPLSGLEQNSFLFRQSSLIGLDHRHVLLHILHNACRRWNLSIRPMSEEKNILEKKPVHILFGGSTAERQVSLMSGTNVWLKLLKSSSCAPSLFMMAEENLIWEVPYSYALNHTVEEVAYYCEHQPEKKLSDQIEEIRTLLEINHPIRHPRMLTLESFINEAKASSAFIFLALHGGIGENGTLQQILDLQGLFYNGSAAEGSKICMDKLLTGQLINELEDPLLISLKKSRVDFLTETNLTSLWTSLRSFHPKGPFVIKPRQDGCSAGIVLLNSFEDLTTYQKLYLEKAKTIPPHTFLNQKDFVTMPTDRTVEFIVEPFIETDFLAVEHNKLIHKQKKGWIELTVGVLESQENYHALNPSITIAEAGVLTLEEKFQGGTGINITPPPPSLIPENLLENLKKLIEKAAKTLQIKNYARIDIFFNRHSQEVIVIEANSLPALTPSTVLFHQGLAEPFPLYPLNLLENLIFNKIQTRSLEIIHA